MVYEINPELRLYISLQLHDSIETQTIIEFKAKKRVTISDYSLVAGTENLSNQLIRELKQFEHLSDNS